MSMYNYLGTPNDNLICCICRAPFLDPLTSKLCSHTFCSSCILQALSHAPQCPIDRTALTERDLERAPGIVRAMVDELEVECVYAPPRGEVHCDQAASKEKLAVNTSAADTNILAGCKWTGERETLGAHLEICEYAEGNNDNRKHHDGSDDTSLSTKVAVIDEDGSQNMTHSPSGTGTSIPPSSPDPSGTSPHLLQSTLQTIRMGCPHAAFGCPYTASVVVSPELGGEDSSAIMQADIETHLASCPYESLKGFLGVFSSTVSSQKQAIDESKRREDTLHATILELKENEKRAKLVLEQNILLKRRLESLEGMLTSLKKELASIRMSLGPWATGTSSSRNATNLATATTSDAGVDLRGIIRYPAVSISGGLTPSAALASSPPATSSPVIPTASDRSPERQSSASHPMQHVTGGWGNGPSEVPLLNIASPFANISPRIDDSGSGNPGFLNDAFAPYFPSAGEEYTQTGTSFHPQHRRATSSVSLPLMIPALDTTSSLEGTLQRLHASVVSIATSVEGLTLQMEGVARRGELGLANEAVRVGEEIGSLRAQIYGLRMLVHGLMVERGMGTRWPTNGPGMNMGEADDEQRNHPGPHFPQTIPMGMPPPHPFFLRNAGLGMGMGPMGGPSITKL